MENNQQNKKSERAQMEERILSFWQENNIFNKTLEKESPEGEFVFYEGPPTANGKPGIHHLEARAFKDALPRYKTMKGYHVRRKGGWDTHGLPVELQVEKELGLKSKKEVETYGVAAFNQKCKESVWQYLDIWNVFTHRIGYWVDQENPYVTYHNSYIESLWNVVGEVYKKGLLYKDYKVVPWCARCGTALSSHELAQGYQDVKDLSVYVKFKLLDKENTYILAWTTTPWTLPGNVALAVGSDIEYVQIQYEGENESYIIAETRLEVLIQEKKYIIQNRFLGSDLVGLKYEPLYPYLKDNLPSSEKTKLDKAFQIYNASFVTTQDGTGVVHTAVMYGQDDFILGTEIGLPKYHLVNVEGKFIEECDFLKGLFVKDEDTAVTIIKDLAHRGLLYKKEKYEHSYPHCWRCKTPLIYYARDSWYIRMSQLRDEMVSENQTINWEPSYIRDGRFGEWLKDIKDWAISRERFWGTPLPLWEKQNKERVVINSLDTLKKYTQKSGNTYILMRHGFTKSNEIKVWSCDPNAEDHVTDEGKEAIRLYAKELMSQNIDIIISSPFVRTKETAYIVADTIGLSKENVIFDPKIGEWQVGSEFVGKQISDYLDWRRAQEESSYTVHTKDGESYQDVVKRSGELLYELEEKYTNKNILIISHGSPLRAIELIASGFSKENQHERISNFNNYGNGEWRVINFSPLPHNEYFELDLHKPYIDEIKLIDEEGNLMQRANEVMDVWFDSGAMPFAQDHYPFSHTEIAYPADFICEAIDQTRGWFYTLHAVGILMGRGKAYKNVICLGHILDAQGKKMSKSLGNIVDPWLMMDMYGVDPLRFFMYTVNQPGESKNFDEKTVIEISRKVFTLLDNVVAFYELYRDHSIETNEYPQSTYILDKWILEKLKELTQVSTNYLDEYKLLEPGRAIRDFIDDLSTWYVRRSRDRLKEKNKETQQTLYFVLKNLSYLLAPFAPFAAEDIYQKLKLSDDKESVHLNSWPVFKETRDVDVISDMQKVRIIVRLGLEARQKANIKVRQPLETLFVKDFGLNENYREIICDELNIKSLTHDATLGEEVLLNTTITPKLKAEGDMRELVRGLQDLRKQKGLQPSQEVILTIDTDEVGKGLVEQFSDEIKKIVGIKEIIFDKTKGEEIKIDELLFVVHI